MSVSRATIPGLVAATIAALTAATGAARAPSDSRADPCPAGRVPPRAGTFGIGGYGNLLFFGDGALWALTEPSGSTGSPKASIQLRRIDPGRRTVERVATLAARGDARFVVSSGVAWIADPESGRAIRIRLADGQTRFIRPFGAGGEPTALALAAGRIWTISNTRGRVAAIDRTTLAVVTRTLVGGTGLADVEAAFGALWVSVPEEQTVVRIDPRSGRIDGRVRVREAVGDLAVAGPWLWADLPDRDAVQPIDPRRLRVAGAKREYESDAFAIAGGFGSLWVTNYGVAKVTRFDGRTGRQLKIYPVGRDPKGIVTGAGSVWTMNAGGCSITRIDPGQS